VLTTRLVHSFGLSASEVGTLLFLEIGVFGLASGPAYLWLSRVNWVTAARVFTGLMILGNAASAFVGDYFLLIAFRILTAFAAGSIAVLILASASRTTNPGRSYGVFLTSQLAVAAILLAFLPAVFPGVSVAPIYLTMAVFAVACWPVSGFLLQGTPASPIPTETTGHAGDKKDYRRNILAVTSLTVILLFYIAVSSAWAFLGEIGINSGVGADASSYTLSAATVAGVIAALAATVLVEHRLKLPFIIVSHLGLIGSMAMLFGTVGVIQFMMAAILFKITYTYLVPYLLAIVAPIDRTGSLMSTANLMIAGGYALGPLAGGFLVDISGGYSSLLVFSMSFMVASLIGCAWAQVQSNRYRTAITRIESPATAPAASTASIAS
jgi:predicted MFS family arabinose efflux permease